MASIIIPEELEQNQRRAVRVEMTAKDPVRFAAGRQKATIINLSESGIAFSVAEPIAHKAIPGVLKFKIDQVYTLKLQVQIINGDPRCYRAEFVDMSAQDMRLMSKLVLGLQKLHIRREKLKRQQESTTE
ncbi:PilZ domain-containing protein [Marinobacterium arenosum]|uniref:PilZ domain-containing protein n=1 Tax=Marinobacterium arenosum TaxID=2862496 RepID=UPI001C9838DF|nr:PilZ domain-containing protein [Marinobacterium arenosum]MBY4679009.1 PilZ domain-containing protein [Marinobacterium arenosum]